MIRYECDKCGLSMSANDPQRFILRFELFAAAGPVDLDKHAESRQGQDLEQVIRQLADSDPDEVENQTYRMLKFDVCDACRRKLLADPLGDHST